MKMQALFAGVLISLFLAGVTLAANVTVLLPDGTTWRGKTDDHVSIEYRSGALSETSTGVLTRAGDLYLVIKKDDGSGEMPIFRSDVISITTADDAVPPAVPKGDAAGPESKGKEPASSSVEQSSSTTKEAEETSRGMQEKGAFYLPLKEMVGLEFRPEEIQQIIAQADEIGPGQIIVLDIESGGGSVIEFIQIAEVLREAKGRHQFVAWVGHAISAAAGTALCCDRIIYKSHGALGAITMHSGGRPVSDEKEEKWITMLKEILRESGHSTHWARPMVRNDSYISFTKDPVTGDCEYYGSPSGMPGEKVLSQYGENAVLNLELALECCLAYGQADNKEELAHVLDLPSWKELGTGQKLSDDWLDSVARCEEYWRKSNTQLSLLGEYEPMIQTRKEIEIYKRWIRWWNRAPNKMMFLGAPSKEQLEMIIEELKIQLRIMAEQGRD